MSDAQPPGDLPANPPASSPANSPVRFEQSGPIVVLTLARPEAANAQSTALLVELDGLLDRIAADPSVQVVLIEAEGRHFSAGHDLQEIMAGDDPWIAQRATPEGKLRHEQALYWGPMVKLHDLRPVTIAAVQGACVAAGLMLACMCDLIVAADDARFSNPVARMSGVGVELLVEPWELGPRKAKEFLLCGLTLDAAAAERAGLVNRVVPRASLAAEARAMAEEVALVPPVTAEAIKRSINGMVDRMGQRDSWQLHFWLHQFVSNTPTALDRAAARQEGGMDAVRREQAGSGPTSPPDPTGAASAPGPTSTPGPTGPTSAAGPTGAPGPTEAAGPTGAASAPDPTGAAGSAGPTGPEAGGAS